MMAETETKSLKAKEKREITTAAELTKPGPTFTPAVDIFETEHEIILLADLPGVKAKDLSIDIHDNVLTLKGELGSPESPKEVDVLREYQIGKYFREFTLSEVIDQIKIEAEMTDGVLRLRLPKVKPEVPRKITVKAA